MQVNLTLTENYEVPEGALSNEQYLEFVLNRAVESYQKQYGVQTVEEGITAACAAYNAALPTEEAEPEDNGAE